MEDKYYLAVEIKPNNYFPINLGDLNIAKNFATWKLEELDNFTLKHTEAEIFKSIKEANLLDINDKMSLVVIYYEKSVIRKTDALTKDKYYDMWDYLKNNYQNKNLINKIYNFLNNKIDAEVLNKLKSSCDVQSFLQMMTKLNYFIQRKLYFYLYEK